MTKKHLITTVIIGVAILFVSAGIYAKSVPDVIPLQDPAYKKHKKGVEIDLFALIIWSAVFAGFSYAIHKGIIHFLNG